VQRALERRQRGYTLRINSLLNKLFRPFFVKFQNGSPRVEWQ